MAKKSMLAREKNRRHKSTNAFASREKLREIIKNPEADYDAKMAAVAKLSKQSRDKSHCRVARRCSCCGRPRAVYRKFSLCRICLRNLAMLGLVPGLVKSSW